MNELKDIFSYLDVSGVLKEIMLHNEDNPSIMKEVQEAMVKNTTKIKKFVTNDLP